MLQPLSMNLMPSFPAMLSAALPQADLALALGAGELLNSQESNSICCKGAELVFRDGGSLPTATVLLQGYTPDKAGSMSLM